MPPKNGKAKAKVNGDADNVTKTEQKRIIDEIYKAPDISDYPMK